MTSGLRICFLFELTTEDFTSKNLKRLFPTDQSMVVVIDDRQDVWGDCPNLVKVVPCERRPPAPSDCSLKPCFR